MPQMYKELYLEDDANCQVSPQSGEYTRVSFDSL